MSINRNALKTYAPKARRDFITAVTARAAKFGITDSEPVPMQEQGEVVIIAGEAFPKEIGAQRKALLGRISQHDFEQIMEAVAYTWFNRFLAIRFMELHGYLDHGFRVLSHPDGGDLPEILEHAEHLDLAGLDKSRVVELKLDGTKDAELYRILLVAQCNTLHDAMPFLFEKIDDETELLLPDNLLHSDSLIRQLVNDIDEADWQEIEIIGWLYQFYISEKKDQVIGKVVKSEDIPAATQLFTPNWIVKYMVQNSLGHQWMATYPESSLKEGMDYYIEPAEQTPEVQAQLVEITPKELKPEELTLLDPAAGSGHILVEAYDLFKQIYLERGYRLKDIPRLILEKNLYGLDIDDRAAQMAGFALLMKARADDRRILSNPVQMNVMAIQSSEGLDATDVAKHLLATDTSGEVKSGTIESLINLFEDAKTFGSLISVPENITQALSALGQLLDQPSSGDLLQRQLREHAVETFRPLVTQSNTLGKSFDCVVANPPYMGSKYYNGSLKKFIGGHFADAKQDLYACFMQMQARKTKKGGVWSSINIPGWMFLSSFANLRRNLLIDNSCILSLSHNGRGVFGSDFGSVAFSILNCKCPKHVGKYKRLFEKQGSVASNEELISRFKNKEGFVTAASDFLKIPGSPIAYWVSNEAREAFDNKLLGDLAKPRQGMATTKNDLFVRRWFEVSLGKSNFSAENQEQALHSGAKWFAYNKGGDYRKWFGNNEHVVNFENSGKTICDYIDNTPGVKVGSNGRVINRDKYFKESITWSFVSSSYFGVRYSPKGFIFDVGGSSIFFTGEEIFDFTGLLCSKISTFFLSIVNPTLNFQVGNIASLPIPKFEPAHVRPLAKEAINIARTDWNSYETSWEFEMLPVLLKQNLSQNLEGAYQIQRSKWLEVTFKMQQLEEEINSIFIKACGLDNDLTPDVPLKEITLNCNPYFRYGGSKAEQEIELQLRSDEIKGVISFAIGCMMGRYSLAEEGLIYANNGNDGFDSSRYGDFPADDDGIIPITDTEWFDDDATVRFEEFLKVAWSPETLKENLKFIGDSLANNGGNDALRTIRNYLSKGFYKDHLKTYKKRPIYWQFSSGKQRAFECLVYLHRYNEGTLARMRMEYVTPLQSRMSARIDQLRGDVESASSSTERTKKQKEQNKLVKQLEELRAFDEELRHYADQRITLDLDDGVKVNYGKFGNLLADVKAITGKK